MGVLDRVASAAVAVVVENSLKAIGPEKIEKVLDKALDWCETAIKSSKTSLDDAILMPLVDLIREALEIED